MVLIEDEKWLDIVIGGGAGEDGKTKSIPWLCFAVIRLEGRFLLYTLLESSSQSFLYPDSKNGLIRHLMLFGHHLCQFDNPTIKT
jgi:hypothetical protein